MNFTKRAFSSINVGKRVTVIGANGIEKVVDIKMTKDEQAMFDKSVAAVQGLVNACKSIDTSLA